MLAAFHSITCICFYRLKEGENRALAFSYIATKSCVMAAPGPHVNPSFIMTAEIAQILSSLLQRLLTLLMELMRRVYLKTLDRSVEKSVAGEEVLDLCSVSVCTLVWCCLMCLVLHVCVCTASSTSSLFTLKAVSVPDSNTGYLFNHGIKGILNSS